MKKETKLELNSSEMSPEKFDKMMRESLVEIKELTNERLDGMINRKELLTIKDAICAFILIGSEIDDEELGGPSAYVAGNPRDLMTVLSYVGIKNPQIFNMMQRAITATMKIQLQGGGLDTDLIDKKFEEILKTTGGINPEDVRIDKGFGPKPE